MLGYGIIAAGIFYIGYGLATKNAGEKWKYTTDGLILNNAGQMLKGR